MKGETAGHSNENNFDLLRLIAAFFVIVSHSFGILGKGLQQPALWYTNKHLILSDVGLYIFFTISGFLVTQSLFNSDSLAYYLWKRFIRIVPALSVVNVVCIITGVFVTSLPASNYLSNFETWTYFIKNTTLVKNQSTLPGVFTSFKDDSVNASIWTILIEVKFYILLFIAAYPILTRKWLFLALFIVFQALRVYVTFFHKISVEGFDFDIYFTYGTYFFLGSLYYCFKEDIPLEWFYANILMAIALITVFTFLQPVTEALFFAYCILIIGNSKAFINLRGYDISYGLYLYAFPVQQLVLLTLGEALNPWLHVVISTVLALVPAFASWIFVERPLLKMKNRKFRLFQNAKT